MKHCHNHCKISWCCSGERFLERKDRWNKDIIKVSEMKGMSFYEWDDTHIVVHVKCPCIALEGTGECCLAEIGTKPEVCSKFPTEEQNGMVLTERCKYFDKDKHISFEGLKKYEPTK